jgi:hypothetical protein
MSVTDAALRHHFTVRLESAPNALARLVEPFVIHDVLPERLESMRGASEVVVHIWFTADADLARRLADRLRAMIPVFDVAAATHADAVAA